MMTLAQRIKQLQEQLRAKKAAHDAKADHLESLRSADEPDQTAINTINTERSALAAECETIGAEIAELRKEAERDEALERLAATALDGSEERNERPAARITSEARTYTAETSGQGVSFFADSYRAQAHGDLKARQRLERHMVEVEREGELTARAQTTGGSSALVIPQYLVDQAALVARAGRPVANAINSLPLPESGMSIVIPRGTTGATVASQATENTAVQSTDEVWANLTVPVVTVAGQQDVSRQLVERGSVGIDQIIYTDLAAAYAAELDRQVINGSGASNQMLGILQTAGTNQAAAFTAAATAQTFWSRFAGAKAAIAANRFAASNLTFMHPDRWGWLEQLVDSQNRPLVVPHVGGPMNTYGVYEKPEYGTVVGTLSTLPVITDANVPTDVGTGPEDIVGVVRKEDLLLWEDGDGMPRELRFDQTLGNQLTVKLVVYGYAAFTAGRYPAAVSKIGGNAGAAGFGLIAPTFV